MLVNAGDPHQLVLEDLKKKKHGANQPLSFFRGCEISPKCEFFLKII
jgi:hypothetical protein